MTKRTVTKEQAKQLAVIYAAFDEACRNKEDLGIAVWGDALMGVQEKLELEMHDPDTVAALVRHARNRMYKKEAA